MIQIRERQIKSGDLLEVDFYPVFKNGQRIPERKPKSKSSTKEQAKYNRTQATKKIVRLVNTNFKTGDLFLHITYDPKFAPQDDKQARRDIANYFKRIRRYRKKHKLPELKYIYVIEKSTYKTGMYAGLTNWHFHIIMSEMDRNTAEDIWGKGIRVNADRFQPKNFGLETAAKYMAKDPQGSKRFQCSRNLEKPPPPKNKDGKTSRNKLAKLAQERCDDRDYWEKRHKGYEFVRTEPRFNKYNGNWYLSVVMYKKQAAKKSTKRRE